MNNILLAKEIRFYLANDVYPFMLTKSEMEALSEHLESDKPLQDICKARQLDYNRVVFIVKNYVKNYNDKNGYAED